MVQVLLINPAWPGLVSRRGQRYNRAWPPLDLLNCAALLQRQGLSVELADARARPLSPAYLRRRAREADWVVITSSPLDRWQCPNLELEYFLDLARGLEHPRLVICGVHGTVEPGPVLGRSRAFALVLGEPEQTVAQLVERGRRQGVAGLAWLEGGEVVTSGPRPPLDLDRLPRPAFELAPPAWYSYQPLGSHLALLETSRGCPYHCSFCLKAMYGPGVRFKSPERVAREARVLARLGARRVYVMDLDFTASRSHALAVCRALSGSGLTWCCQARADQVDRPLLRAMAASGCALIHFGVESASRQALRRSGKGLEPEQVVRAVDRARSLGMATACFFLFGLPGESPADRARTASLARRLKTDYCSFHRVTPYPGTRLFQDSDLPDPFFAAETGPRDEIDAALRRAYLGFYLQPARLFRILARSRPGDWVAGLRLLAGFLR